MAPAAASRCCSRSITAPRDRSPSSSTLRWSISCATTTPTLPAASTTGPRSRSASRRRGAPSGSGAERYDLIQIPLLYSFGAAAAGTQSLHESYTYTVEAMEDYLAALEPGGILSITLWLKLPPRDSVKLFATAVEALQRAGRRRSGRAAGADPQLEHRDPSRQERRLSAPEIAALARFRRRRAPSISPGHPGISPRRGQPLQRPRAALFLRGGHGPSRPGPAALPRRTTSSRSRRRPTTGPTSSISSNGASCRSCCRSARRAPRRCSIWAT